jgi:hypothetical protein
MRSRVDAPLPKRSTARQLGIAKNLKTKEIATDAFFQRLGDVRFEVTIQLARLPKLHKILHTLS